MEYCYIAVYGAKNIFLGYIESIDYVNTFTITQNKAKAKQYLCNDVSTAHDLQFLRQLTQNFTYDYIF